MKTVHGETSPVVSDGEWSDGLRNELLGADAFPLDHVPHANESFLVYNRHRQQNSKGLWVQSVPLWCLLTETRNSTDHSAFHLEDQLFKITGTQFWWKPLCQIDFAKSSDTLAVPQFFYPRSDGFLQCCSMWLFIDVSHSLTAYSLLWVTQCCLGAFIAHNNFRSRKTTCKIRGIFNSQPFIVTVYRSSNFGGSTRKLNQNNSKILEESSNFSRWFWLMVH